MKKEFKKLTSAERFVITDKGTERPFTGRYNDFYESGTYTCKRCGLPLYRSKDKFKSDCGWPSFDDEIPGAVRKRPDADGVRTEITCAYCGAHLGHVFKGEGYTPKNLRHCVNSVSMNFVPAGEEPEVAAAFFAAGCFWGVEHLFKRLKGVVGTKVGYMGGTTENPTYEEVCTDATDHAETVEILYSPGIISYDQLVRFFFEIHDFSQTDRQGPDVGRQYRSAIFCTDESQMEISSAIKSELGRDGKFVATKIEMASDFWSAEEYHQDYYEKTGKAPYCHYRRKVFKEFFI